MKLATIEQISEIKSVDNFDKVEIAVISNNETVVPKNKYKVGDIVIYVHIDTVLPQDEKFDVFRKYAKTRVKTTRIGNKQIGYIYSQGFILDLDYLLEKDVSELLGITKYEVNNENNICSNLQIPIPKTDEERYQNVSKYIDWDNIYGDITLKIDGTSFTALYDLDKEEFSIYSRKLKYDLTTDSIYAQIALKYDLENKLAQYCKEHKISLALRGEIYGTKIQTHRNNHHSKLPLDVAFYSVYNVTNDKYEMYDDLHYFEIVCEKLNLPQIPMLENHILITKELVEYYENLEYLEPYGYFEGVVVKTNNLSFKVINKHYDLNK